jgi:hypothetical protein
MIHTDETYTSVKINSDLRLTPSIFLNTFDNSLESFGGIRIGPSVWEDMQVGSITKKDVFDEKVLLKDINPFTGKYSLTWFFKRDVPYISLNRLEGYSEQLSPIDDYSETRQLEPNVLYCPINNTVITKELKARENEHFSQSEYLYKLHTTKGRKSIDLNSIYAVPDRTLLRLLPQEYTSKILSVTI